MSMVLTFYRVTPEQLDRATQDPDWATEYLEENEKHLPHSYTFFTATAASGDAAIREFNF
ncbi:MAG: DUF1877 family protein [Actinocatenispora sp.]